MSSEDASTIALAPFIRYFTYAVVKSLRVKNLSEKKHILHADMVPKVSEKVMQASLGERKSSLQQDISSEMVPSTVSDQQPISTLGAPQQEVLVPQLGEPQFTQKPDQVSQQVPSIMEPKALPKQQPVLVQPPRMPPRRAAPPVQRMALPMQQMAPPSVPEGEELTQFYGKITPLLNDPSISIIECSGANKPLMAVRRGQKQPTKITLSAKEIQQVLDKVSEAAHIPLLEGVFRAAVDTFSINAVISEVIGSRFVIRKQSPSPRQPMPPRR